MLKKCTKCGINKYLKEFYISGAVISARCKKCTNKIKIQKKKQNRKKTEENIKILQSLSFDENGIMNESFVKKDYEYIKNLNTESEYYETRAFMRFIKGKKIEMVRQDDVKRDKILIFY